MLDRLNRAPCAGFTGTREDDVLVVVAVAVEGSRFRAMGLADRNCDGAGPGAEF
jgi:hypothetical protein